MKVLVAKVKENNKIRYYNGKRFVIGKSRALDISKFNDETINMFIHVLYEHLSAIQQVGKIEYFTMDI